MQKKDENMEFEISNYRETKGIILTERVQYFYEGVMGSRLNHVNRTLGNLTPIEQLMYLSLIYLKNKGEEGADEGKFDMLIQPKFKLSGKRYIPDFVLISIRDGETLLSVIECDGHDFHEKTKQQVKKDKQRDRDFIKAGYKVIRFSGSEIYDDPMECAEEALIIHYGYSKKEDFYDKRHGNELDELYIPGFDSWFYAKWHSIF